MSGKDRFLIAAFVAVTFFSVLGILHLFTLRFEKGDMFPPYSSLRSDPLGCKALFMALERAANLEAGRNYRDPARLEGAQGRTIYFMGTDETLLHASSDGDARDLDALAGEGNRLVIALAVDREAPSEANEKDDKADCDTCEKKRMAAPATAHPSPCRKGVWGVELEVFAPPAGPTGERPRADRIGAEAGLPPAIPLHSRCYFKVDGKGWRTVYGYGERAIVLERRVGTGSIVLMADSYLVSNEALRNDRCPEFLAWLQGSGRTALFDEYHLGVSENPGVMALIKKHGLVPLLLSLLALALLHVWKNAVPFAAPAPAGESLQAGARDNFSGLVNLLRRNVAPDKLLGACFSEWSRSFSREIREYPEVATKLRAIMDEEAARPAGKRDPVAGYKRMAELLKRHFPGCIHKRISNVEQEMMNVEGKQHVR